LIGSEAVSYFAGRGETVFGIDNNMRGDFFGPAGDTRWNTSRLLRRFKAFKHYELDIRNRAQIGGCIEELRPDLIVHAAAQPSHDLAATRPFDDFDVNAVGTLNLLEATRRYAPNAVFVHISTNKVYGDAPNELEMVELATRWDYANPSFINGIAEDFRIDQSKHSLFGASKLAADIMVQEYGRYFGIHTCCLRGGCVTGPAHSGVALHGFLSYLVKVNLEGGVYKIQGYKGKQVRDNIHALDVVRLIDALYTNPRCGEVYNLGGGRVNSCSILEAFAAVEGLTGKKMKYEILEKNREGDHICYISDLRKMKSHFPAWEISVPLEQIFSEIIKGWSERGIG
jgi:CDP-paratose 2-epimerase